MPYIKPEQRKKILLDNTSDHAVKYIDMRFIQSAGDLNYAITELMNDFIKSNGGVNYSMLNTLVGVLECAKLELYRRIAVPYEEDKMMENGDVYPV